MTYDSLGSEQPRYYHLCSDGALTPHFLLGEEDFRMAFNLVGACAANCEINLLAFSLEDTHLHALSFGTKTACLQFSAMFGESWAHHVGRTRGTRKKADIELDVIPVDSEDYLMGVGTYVIVQPTKDGKKVMPYDYRWGTGSMYFRGSGHRSIWTVDVAGGRLPTVRAGDLSRHQTKELLGTRRPVPDEWQLCGGLLLPDNYIDVARFESIYRTANCFRVFLSSNRSRDQAIQERIAAARGVALEDVEARMHCHEFMNDMYGFKDVRRLDAHQRIVLAQHLVRKLHLSRRQTASLVMLPFSEVCKYV